MKKLFFYAAAAVALASCSSNDYLGNAPDQIKQGTETGEIQFGSNFRAMTRADIYGNAAATLLGNHFYVTGTKGTEAATSPTPTLVFDNYLVRYGKNTAGTTESNTANWEYVGVTPGTSPDANYVQLGSYQTGDGHSGQTIKYWDYSTDQYDFLAFSTGTKNAVKGKAIAAVADGEINVTEMKYGTDLAGSGIAYTFGIPTIDALKNAFISDITEVKKSNYGNEVQLRFKNLGSKVRVALYETVPGYSVKDVKFYKVDGTNDGLGTGTDDNAFLIGANNNSFATKGTIKVYFPSVGNSNDTKQDYDKASATVTPATGTYVQYKEFGALTNQLVGPDKDEAAGNHYIGRTLPNATFAGEEKEAFYQTVFPASTSYALTLRVDYTLVSTDGSTEEIKVYGAKAVVPSTYTKWLPNYAYTYIFKISDNTNGWTATDATKPGLFPITFDAVVAEATDATAEQKTITTVATPFITTYQQNHDNTKDEYSKATAKNIYVQVMDNSTTTPTLKNDLNGDDPWIKSKLYEVTSGGAAISEATVMDALQNRTTAIEGKDDANLKGRNGITLTKNNSINNTVTQILNGADDQPITQINGTNILAGQVAELNISALTAGTYAYVYDYSDDTKKTVTEYQPISVTNGSAIGTSGQTFASITIGELGSTETAADEPVDKDYIYFSKTKNGTDETTYSYVSVAGKATLPKGLIKVKKTTLTTNVPGTTVAVADTFYFDIYTTNDGKYAVKIIKIVAS